MENGCRQGQTHAQRSQEEPGPPETTPRDHQGNGGFSKRVKEGGCVFSSPIEDHRWYGIG